MQDIISIILSPVSLAMFTLMLVYYLYYMAHSLALLAQWPVRIGDHRDPEDRYELWLMIPALNEEPVIQKTVTSLLEATGRMPSNIQCHVLVIDDDSDDGTLLKSAALTTTIRTPKETSRTGKGAVLNCGVQYIMDHHDRTVHPDHIIIGVMDADGSMTTDSLMWVMRSFAYHDVDMVQTAVRMHRTTSLLQKSQEYDFGESNRKQQLLRSRYGQGIASGNGQFVTLELAVDVQWGNALLEDMEFTIRAWLRGYRTMFIDQAIVYQEAVRSVRSYTRQRTRWCMGGLQCARYLPSIWISSNITAMQKICMTTGIIGPLAAPPIWIGNLLTLIVQVALIIVTGNFIFLAGLLGIWFALQLAGAFDYRMYTRRHRKPMSYLTALVSALSFQACNFTLNSIIPVMAIIKLAMGRVSWSKTVHGQ